MSPSTINYNTKCFPATATEPPRTQGPLTNSVRTPTVKDCLGNNSILGVRVVWTVWSIYELLKLKTIEYFKMHDLTRNSKKSRWPYLHFSCNNKNNISNKICAKRKVPICSNRPGGPKQVRIKTQNLSTDLRRGIASRLPCPIKREWTRQQGGGL